MLLRGEEDLKKKFTMFVLGKQLFHTDPCRLQELKKTKQHQVQYISIQLVVC
jgi:hypothetical protein